MINKDKFGNPIYESKFKILLKYSKILISKGYSESTKKPNLFYKKLPEGLFFADMRGTEEVPIWRDPSPLFYCKFNEDIPKWKRNRLKSEEFKDLKSCNVRQSFYQDEEILEEYYEIVDKFIGSDLNFYFDSDDLIEDGYCIFCNKDMQKEGLFCDDKCKKKFIWQKQKEHDEWIETQKETCELCKEKIGYQEEIEHHVSYFPEKKIILHKKCHNKIHKTNKHPELKPSKEDVKKFYLKQKKEKICPTCKKPFKNNRKTYCNEKCRPSYKPPKPPREYIYIPPKKYRSPMLDAWS
jgi:hypothetical protein